MGLPLLATTIPLFGGAFGFDALPAGVALGAILLYMLLSRYGLAFEKPRVKFSSTEFPNPETLSSRWSNLPHLFLLIAGGLFAAALADPRIYLEKGSRDTAHPPLSSTGSAPVEGVAVYLVLDQSGSMRGAVSAGRRRSISKIDLLKQVTRQFIIGDDALGLGGRPNDMIGLISFARGASVLSPLTLDHEAVLHELSQLAPVQERDKDGTSIGYAIFKAASLIAATRHYAQEIMDKGEPAYAINSSVMILITDGLQDPNPLDKGKRLRNMDVPEAAAYAAEKGIRLYIINVEPKLATDEFAPYRRIMQRAAEETGGRFYMVDDTGNLASIYKQIDALEKSVLPGKALGGEKYEMAPDRYRRISFYPFLIIIALYFLFSSVVLDATLMRRFP